MQVKHRRPTQGRGTQLKIGKLLDGRLTRPETGIEKTLDNWPKEVKKDMNNPFCFNDAHLEVTKPTVGIQTAKLAP